MRFLVTAGNTREMIDRVRDWGNIFTGNTGLAIAKELSKLGQVDLLTSNAGHLRPGSAINAESFSHHAQLRRMLAERMTTIEYAAVFMTAAVADYRPNGAFSIVSRKQNPDGTESWLVQNAQQEKIKSIHKLIAILGAPTEKLIDLFRTEWAYRGLLVKFKLEVGITEDELKEIAGASRLASGADYIVANTLEMVQGTNPGAWLIGDSIAERVDRDRLPHRLAGLVQQ